MTTIFQYVKIKESQSLSAMTQNHLDKPAQKYPWLITARVFFKKENASGDFKNTCEIQLSVPGPSLFASTTDIYFETAMKETVSDLERQLKKRKAQFTNQNISS